MAAAILGSHALLAKHCAAKSGQDLAWSAMHGEALGLAAWRECSMASCPPQGWQARSSPLEANAFPLSKRNG